MSGEQVTVSRVLINRDTENAYLRSWCDKAAEAGGRFAIEQKWGDGNWYTEYTIVWPEGGKEGGE